jgi:hypothetical protein
MVSTIFAKRQARAYVEDQESREMAEDESVPLQSSMGRAQKTVLIQRLVAQIGKKKSARARSQRLSDRTAKLRLILNPSYVPPIPEYPASRKSKTWSRPDASGEEGSSEDWPCSRGVRIPAVSDAESDHSEGVEDEEFDDIQSFSSQESEVRSVASARGEEIEEDERELTSEEESEESQSDNDVIFVREEIGEPVPVPVVRKISASSAALRQSLVSQFFKKA